MLENEPHASTCIWANYDLHTIAMQRHNEAINCRRREPHVTGARYTTVSTTRHGRHKT